MYLSPSKTGVDPSAHVGCAPSLHCLWRPPPWPETEVAMVKRRTAVRNPILIMVIKCGDKAVIK